MIEAIVTELERHGNKIFIINDGSNGRVTHLLSSMDEARDLVEVIHLTQNQGKGCAVLAGVKNAQKQGFTHAFQIDADGQHSLDEVAIFLQLSETNPDAVINGNPCYDKSVPLGRLLPRYITHFWVWLETLSFCIKDSMCGFRIYPIAPVTQINEQYKIGQRMDFDTEIIVRLFWAGLRIINSTVKVTYPTNGISHFKMVRDNLLISWMHTRLCFGMLMLKQ